MAKDPTYPMYAQDFDMDTSYWDVVEVGAYIRLLNACWINNGLPRDLKRLSTIARMGLNDFQDIWETTIKVKFFEREGFYFNAKQEEVRAYRKKQKENGSEGGRPKLDTQITDVDGKQIPRNVSDSDHFIYVFKDLETGNFKVGETKNLWNRRLSIKVPTNRLQIIIFQKIQKEEALKIELGVKSLFPNSLINGDWFSFSPEEIDSVIDHIKKVKKPKKNLSNEIEIEDEFSIGKEIKEGVLGEGLEVWPTFEDFWELYDKKRSRSKAEKLWKGISQDQREAIMEYIPSYIQSQPDKNYRKDPDTFLRNESWKDEIISKSKTNGSISKEGARGALEIISQRG